MCRWQTSQIARPLPGASLPVWICMNARMKLLAFRAARTHCEKARRPDLCAHNVSLFCKHILPFVLCLRSCHVYWRQRHTKVRIHFICRMQNDLLLFFRFFAIRSPSHIAYTNICRDVQGIIIILFGILLSFVCSPAVRNWFSDENDGSDLIKNNLSMYSVYTHSFMYKECMCTLDVGCRMKALTPHIFPLSEWV